MNINTLDYRETDAWGLSFELLVDRHPISQLIGAWDTAIPHWLITGDLPTLPVHYDAYAPEIRVLAVAKCCGEVGCGHARCRVVAEQDTIIFCDFAGEASSEGQTLIFRFSRKNYADVVRAMAWRTVQYRRLKQ